jgi:hypothetical protein
MMKCLEGDFFSCKDVWIIKNEVLRIGVIYLSLCNGETLIEIANTVNSTP